MGRDTIPGNICASLPNFNPRAPYGARRTPFACFQQCSDISIHAPRMGRDSRDLPDKSDTLHFNPRAPYGARPGRASRAYFPMYFNPRAPYGARQARRYCNNRTHRFQSTRPVWGATAFAVGDGGDKGYFNPRAPYGARLDQVGRGAPIPYFNPRAPYGARL